MKTSHNHPGQAEPRSHGETHHELRELDLNAASLEELVDLPMVGPKRAKELMERRPFESWEDVASLPGFSVGMIDDLKSGGAILGGGERNKSRQAEGSREESAGTSEADDGHEAQVTTDHKFIREWAEERQAKPSAVKGTGGKHDVGIIRLDFPGYSGADSLEEITWEEWFEKFEESKLALLYQEQTADGEKSNFNKLINRRR